MSASLAECVAALLRADGDNERSAAHERLVLVVRGRVIVELQWAKAPDDVRDDIAQEVTLRIVAWFSAGDVTAGREEAFVRRCVRNALFDHYRRTQARHEVAIEQDDMADPDNPDPEEMAIRAAEGRQREDLIASIAVLIENAPEPYRQALIDVYATEPPRTPEDLVRDELARRGQLGAGRVPTGQDIRRARAVIDQRLHRAREWVKARLAQKVRGS